MKPTDNLKKKRIHTKKKNRTVKNKLLLGVGCCSVVLFVSMGTFTAINRTTVLEAKSESTVETTTESTMETTTSISESDMETTTTQESEESTVETVEPSTENSSETSSSTDSSNLPDETSTVEESRKPDTENTSTTTNSTTTDSTTTTPSSSQPTGGNSSSTPPPVPVAPEKPRPPIKQPPKVENQPQVKPPVVSIAPGNDSPVNYATWYGQNVTTQGFIDRIAKDAQTIAWENDLYASVMIAQAILESGSGNSQLASPPNHNLFGIKGNYQGKNVSMLTGEDDGSGKLYMIKASFRAYPSYKESLEDYAHLLTQSSMAPFYKGVRKSETSNYQHATAYLTGRYATDTNYAGKLNGLIAAYGLQKYDQLDDQITEVKKEVFGPTAQQVTVSSTPNMGSVSQKERLENDMWEETFGETVKSEGKTKAFKSREEEERMNVMEMKAHTIPAKLKVSDVQFE